MSDEPLHEKQKIAAIAMECFTAMANRIEDNLRNGFAGAFVIVAPDGSLKETLLLNHEPNPAMLWALVEAAANQAKYEMDTQQNQWERRR